MEGKMNEQEINKKLAEWAGFKQVTKHEVYDKGYYTIWETDTGYPLARLPDFTSSLDACFQYLVPKLNTMERRIHMITQPRGRRDFFCSIGGKYFPHYTTYAEAPTLALCKAILKLIEAEE
jgi:hypothetical protein